VLSVGDVRVAVVAFTDDMPDWEAGTLRPGIWYVPLKTGNPRFEHLLSSIDEVKKNSDLVIVPAQCGPNWGYFPLAEHVEAARLFIDRGADVVFGHSPHVVRGVEIYRTKPILYSCGNYIDDYAVDVFEPNDESCMFCLGGEQGRLRRIVLIPTIIREFQAQQALGAEQAQILRKMKGLCARLGTKTRKVPEGLEISLTDDSHPLRIGTLSVGARFLLDHLSQIRGSAVQLEDDFLPKSASRQGGLFEIRLRPRPSPCPSFSCPFAGVLTCSEL
jgi:hypothetical protein